MEGGRSCADHEGVEPAFASFEDPRKGSLEPGMLADVVVLSAGIFKEAPGNVQHFGSEKSPVARGFSRARRHVLRPAHALRSNVNQRDRVND